MKEALNIPAAKTAIDAEWHKLEVTQQAWDKSTVMSKADDIASARSRKKKVYFGSLMDLCHEKHSELKAYLRKFKAELYSEVIRFATNQVTSWFSPNRGHPRLISLVQSFLMQLQECPDAMAETATPSARILNVPYRTPSFC